ncbi:recombinase family protein [Nocardia farcinica]|uniref:recombinase family protein n=1 Tax=Nocardia farcinica TaxID=37329 RepID=UPI002B4B182C|nr:recombinase family protein [Nocardia farcinica]
MVIAEWGDADEVTARAGGGAGAQEGVQTASFRGPAAVRLRANFSRPSRSALAFPRPAPGPPCPFLLLIGYGRVSTAEQNPDHQIDALHRAGVATDDIHIDTASGAKASRPQLDLVLKIAREVHEVGRRGLPGAGRSGRAGPGG